MDIRRKFIYSSNEEITPDMCIISYTTTDSSVENPYDVTVFGNIDITSNVYVNGEGILKFNNVVRKIGNKAFYQSNKLKSITIPTKVVTIGDFAFYNCKNLENFYGKFASDDNRSLIINNTLFFYALASGNTYVIPNFIEEIYRYAFAFSNLTDIEFSNNTTTIGEGAFYSCSNLTNVVGNNIKNIGSRAFYSCKKIKNINLPNVTTIGDTAFGYCENLENVFIGNYINNIGNNAFSYTKIKNLNIKNTSFCKFGSHVFSSSNVENVYIDSLINGDKTTFTDSDSNPLHSGANLYLNDTLVENLNVPASIRDIDDYGMYGCASIKTLQFAGENVYTGYHGFAKCNNLESVDFQNVLGIDSGSFENCSNLATLLNLETVTHIGNGAFSNCTSLKNLILPENVTSIGHLAFSDCTSLETVEILNTTHGLFEDFNIFSGCSNLYKFIGPHASEDGRILFRNSEIIAIASYGLTYYNIPEYYTNIPDGAFKNCATISEVVIPDVEKIPINSFRECVNLVRINIPNSVTTIGDCAFWGCNSLTSITIPDSVTTIGAWAFSSCSSLTSVYCKATVPPTLGNTAVFDSISSDCKIYVPAESVEAYKSATRGDEYASSIVGYNFENNTVIE